MGCSKVRQAFPGQYSTINESVLPAELYPNQTVVEYTLEQPVPYPPAFVFVLDLSLTPRDLQVRGQQFLLASRSGRRTRHCPV